MTAEKKTMSRSKPLQVQFLVTSLPVGGAELLLLNLVRRLDRKICQPEVICLKGGGELERDFSEEVAVHTHLLRSKWDLRVVPRLIRLMRNHADAVITVGAGDKMFWGRLSARLAGVPVVCSALHSTGWPDSVGFLNRCLTPITDGFIACAQGQANYLSQHEQFPASRVFVIPNGVDTDRFRPNHSQRPWLRRQLGISADAPVIGIVAALRPEKNHLQFLEAAREVSRDHADAHFVIVGDGPERVDIEVAITHHGLKSQVHMLGNREDTHRILAGLDVFCLTSQNEALPVSILEASACGIPVVSPDVGSISETIRHDQTGLLTEPLSSTSTATAISQLLRNPERATQLGLAGRQHIRANFSLDSMVSGYEHLVTTLYNAGAQRVSRPLFQRPQSDLALASPASVPVAELSTPQASVPVSST